MLLTSKCYRYKKFHVISKMKRIYFANGTSSKFRKTSVSRLLCTKVTSITLHAPTSTESHLYPSSNIIYNN